MNLHDRLRDELHDRSDNIEVHGAGSRAVIASARGRTTRTRIAGVAVAAMLVIGVGGIAFSLRGGGGDSVATGDVEAADLIDLPVVPDAATTDAPKSDAVEGSAKQSAAEAVGSGGDEVATTEVGGTPSVATEEAEPESAPASVDDAAPTSDNDGSAVTSGPQIIAQLAHNGGFVSIQAGPSLAFSADFTTWDPIADPRPDPAASITKMVSHAETLYVAGITPVEGASQPWVAMSSDLSSWTHLLVPAPADDGSPLTHISTVLYSLDVDSSGIIITGETFVDLDVAQLVSAEVFSNDSWTLGDSLGDLTKLVVYDIETGSPINEIDLITAGVPPSTLDLLDNAAPLPFVARADSSGDLIQISPDLEPGAIVSGAFFANGDIIGGGWSSRFASHVLWSLEEGQIWTALPVSVVVHDHVPLAGAIAGRVVAFTGQGPILTVQYRDGDVWSEIRLDRLFGRRNDTYEILDASFGADGVVAIAATIDEAQVRELHLLRSVDGTTWDVHPLADVTPSGAEIVGIDAIAIGNGVALSYERADDTYESIILPMG